jgi:L-Ala-D/L-Glu epimerase
MPIASPLAVRAEVERWPIAGKFVISRGARTTATTVLATVSDESGRAGRGECVPYARYGETVESVVAAIESAPLGRRPDRQALRRGMPAGAARNALDCAIWDVECKRNNIPAWKMAGLEEMRAVTTAYTINLGTPDEMAEAASRAAGTESAGTRATKMPLLKIKLGGDGDAERVRAVRAAAPGTRLIVDANEAWDEGNFEVNMKACAEARVELVEQPLPAGQDTFLRDVEHAVPICADESLHTTADLAGLEGKYDAVNVKLDKAGGLTEALDVVREARRAGYRIMVGCMVGTSLAMAPALLLAQQADFVDLDGPLLLARDRAPGLVYSGAMVQPPSAELWG